MLEGLLLVATFFAGVTAMRLFARKKVAAETQGDSFWKHFVHHNREFDGTIFMFLLFITLWVTYMNPMGLESDVKADLIHLFTYSIGVITGFLFKESSSSKNGGNVQR